MPPAPAGKGRRLSGAERTASATCPAQLWSCLPVPQNARTAGILPRARTHLIHRCPIRSSWTTSSKPWKQAGSPAKNPALREALGWEEPLYEEVKADLVAKGIVTRGRGRSADRAPKSFAPSFR